MCHFICSQRLRSFSHHYDRIIAGSFPLSTQALKTKKNYYSVNPAQGVTVLSSLQRLCALIGAIGGKRVCWKFRWKCSNFSHSMLFAVFRTGRHLLSHRDGGCLHYFVSVSCQAGSNALNFSFLLGAKVFCHNHRMFLLYGIRFPVREFFFSSSWHSMAYV